MKKIIRNYFSILLVFALVIGVCGLFMVRKSGWFVDEIYTYGLSNSYYKPFVTDLAEGGIVDRVLTRETLLDYLTVSEGERFAFGSVYYNQAQDVHPPLYYWLFHIVHSFFPGFSKWPALGLDLVLYLLALFVLWRLSMELFGKREIAAVVTGLYGLSGIGVSTMLMVRMYVLLTLLTLVLALLAARLMREQKKWLYPLVGLTIFAGLMTQYYFVFYAFFLCAAYDIRALIRRDWKDFFRFSVWAVLGVAALVVAFPACLRQLFADALVSGGNAVDNFKNIASYGERFSFYWESIRFSVRGMLYALFAAAVLGAAALPFGAKKLRGESKISRSLLLVIPAAVTYALVVIISPVLEPRYIYNVMPVLALSVGFVLSPLFAALDRKRFGEVIGFMLTLAACVWAVWTVRTYPPDYLYPEQRDYNAAIGPYAHGACVYFNADRKGAMTQDFTQLIRFDEVFVADDPASPALADHLAAKDSDSLVVYIDTNKFWSSGFDADEILAGLEKETGYRSPVLLYKYELSETYLLTKSTEKG